MVTVVSAVLLVATLAAWVRAQFATHGVIWAARVDAAAAGTPTTFVGLYGGRGSLVVVRRDAAFLRPGEVPGLGAAEFASIEATPPDGVAAEIGRYGGIEFTRDRSESIDLRGLPAAPGDRAAQRWGFGYARLDQGAASTQRLMLHRVRGQTYLMSRSRFDIWMAPWWFLTAVFAVVPARAAWRWRRARRRRLPHQCAGCGYDLRATADADGPRLAVCPECGRAGG